MAVLDVLATTTTTGSAIRAAASSVPSLRKLSNLALNSANLILGGSGGQQAILGGVTQACSNPQLSCHNTTVVENLCCFNAPGGQLLQTQFWDTHPATGPDDSWTLHGLWPDRCDGSYDANCDSSRVYRNITDILTSFNRTDLLEYMHIYWKDYKGDDENFWQHEWSKHGTCISTLEPQCYSEHRPTEEVVDYFDRAVELFKQLPSYKWLADAGITPSTTQTYTFSAIQDALAVHRPGVTVTLGCKYGALNEIWYHYAVRGSLQHGEFVPADPDGTKSSCPKSGIRYLPKHRRSRPSPTATTTTISPTATSVPGKPFEGRGHLDVLIDGVPKGCIISKGTWYASGTCATFKASVSGNGFSLSSRKGKCGVGGGAFSCGPGVHTATSFTAVDGKLAAGGNAAWSADKVAHGFAKVKVWAGADHDRRVSIVWRGA